MRNFLWASKSPSQWILNVGLRSHDQFDTAKYLPIICSPDYYMIPSVNELAVMNVFELQHVVDITIGLEGYGQIKCAQPVDVRGFVIDDCV